MKRSIQHANVAFLSILVLTLLLPPGAVHRALADPPPDPCLQGATTQDCVFHTSWMQMHSQFWTSMWDLQYHYGQSFMSVEPPETPESETWEVKVWLDMGLDYTNPNLTLAQVEAQNLGTAEFDVAATYYLDDASSQYEDPGTGVITTRTTTIWSVAGVVTGSTELSKPVAGAIIKSELSNSLEQQTTTFHFELIQTPATLGEAMATAIDIHSAFHPSLPGQEDCFSIGYPDECCYCDMDRAACYEGCRGVFWSTFGSCMPPWAAIVGSAVGCSVCAGLLIGGAWTTPIGIAGLIVTCGTCLGGVVYTIAKCWTQARGAELQCRAVCDRDWLRCLRENNCPPPTEP